MVAALLLWLVSRLFDGLDGVVARRQGSQSDFGGYVDLLLDAIVYAAVPVALSLRAGTPAAYVAGLVLLAVFYVNIVSWTVLSSILEKRRAEAQRSGATGSAGNAAARMTTIAMPSGLIEGTETLAFYTLFLIVPGAYIYLAGLMSVLTAVTVLQRLLWARRTLTRASEGPGRESPDAVDGGGE
jgi:phosphatidylglycerophosphate synthase